MGLPTVQILDVVEGMTLDRLDYARVGRPAYVRARVVTVEPVRHVAPGWHRIEWSDGARGVYGPTQRFIRVETP